MQQQLYNVFTHYIVYEDVSPGGILMRKEQGKQVYQVTRHLLLLHGGRELLVLYPAGWRGMQMIVMRIFQLLNVFF